MKRLTVLLIILVSIFMVFTVASANNPNSNGFGGLRVVFLESQMTSGEFADAKGDVRIWGEWEWNTASLMYNFIKLPCLDGNRIDGGFRYSEGAGVFAIYLYTDISYPDGVRLQSFNTDCVSESHDNRNLRLQDIPSEALLLEKLTVEVWYERTNGDRYLILMGEDPAPEVTTGD